MSLDIRLLLAMKPVKFSFFFFLTINLFFDKLLGKSVTDRPVDLRNLNIRANPPGCGLLPAGRAHVPELEGHLIRHVFRS